jgi:hypothetical protein
MKLAIVSGTPHRQGAARYKSLARPLLWQQSRRSARAASPNKRLLLAHRLGHTRGPASAAERLRRQRGKLPGWSADERGELNLLHVGQSPSDRSSCSPTNHISLNASVHLHHSAIFQSTRAGGANAVEAASFSPWPVQMPRRRRPGQPLPFFTTEISSVAHLLGPTARLTGNATNDKRPRCSASWINRRGTGYLLRSVIACPQKPTYLCSWETSVPPRH